MAKRTNPLLKKLNYPVLAHANSILYMFGGISAVAFLILIASGILLAQVYSPTPGGAHQSIIHAVTTVPFADFVRGLHFWTANLVVILLLFHVIRVFITGSYKKPRRLTWLTGVALLAVTVLYIFVGTVLKWDQEGVEAYGHLKESMELFGIHLGLTNGGVPIITQLYSWHINVLLLTLLGLLAVHMLLIKLQGISTKPTKNAVAVATAGHGSSSFLVHLRRLSGFGLLFFAVVGLLAALFPTPIGYPGVLEQEVTKPLWLYWPFFGLEDIFGLKGLVWGMAGFFTFLAAAPFIDQSPYIHYSKRKGILALGAFVLAGMIGLGIFSRLHPQEAHLGMSDNNATTMAMAATYPVSHRMLRSETPYIVPVMLGVGVIGMVLIRKPQGEIRNSRNHAYRKISQHSRSTVA